MYWKNTNPLIVCCGMLLLGTASARAARFVPPSESGNGANLLNVIELELKQKNPAEAVRRADELLRTRYDELVSTENGVTRSVGAMVNELLLSQRPAMAGEYGKQYAAAAAQMLAGVEQYSSYRPEEVYEVARRYPLA